VVALTIFKNRFSTQDSLTTGSLVKPPFRM